MSTQKAAHKLTILAAALIGFSAVHAEVLTDYDNWVVDRLTPSEFSNIGSLNDRSDVLEVDIAADDVSTVDNFYNNQGRGTELLDAPAEYAVIHGSLYVPRAWEFGTAPNDFRNTALWGFAVDSAAGSPTTAHYPIVGFVNTGGDATGNATAGEGRLRVFDSNRSWIPESYQPVQYDAWNDVCFVLNDDRIQTYVNGNLAHVQEGIVLSGVNADSFNRLVVNTYNYGADYTSHWSNLGAGTLNTVAIIAGSTQTAPAGSAFEAALSVEARDSAGAPLPCVPVTFTAPASGASTDTATTTVLTDYLGRATFTARANGSLGTYAVRASAPGIQEEATPSFSLTNSPAIAVNVAPVPTLSQWSLILTMAMLAVFGFLRLRRTN